MNKKSEKTETTVPEVVATPTAVVAVEELKTELNAVTTKEGVFDVSLLLLDSASFESAGYTIEFTYDPVVLKVVEVTEGTIWDKNVVLQKDLSVPGKIAYSLGRGLQASASGGNVMAVVKFQVLDESVDSTEVSLTQVSKSAGDKNVKTIVAEPLTLKLK